MSHQGYGAGNWFHSRTSSSRGEIEKIVTLVKKSTDRRFDGVRWSGASDTRVLEFAQLIDVDAATMQTKIRHFIRLGVLKDDPFLPLKWTRQAGMWRKFTDSGLRSAVRFGELILSQGIALYAFTSDGFTSNPNQGYRPLQALVKELTRKRRISERNFTLLVGSRNKNYWRLDFTRAGILEEESNDFILTPRFRGFLRDIGTPFPTLSDGEWQQIREDFFADLNPFKNAIVSGIDEVLSQAMDRESLLAPDETPILDTLFTASSSREREAILHGDFGVKDQWSKVKSRKKQSAWSQIVRENYDFKCCMPACDVEGIHFTIAAHIKRYRESDGEPKHRANPSNGLCLCPLCHSLFDSGYFTLTTDSKVGISPKTTSLASETLRRLLTNSEGKSLRQGNKYAPDPAFTDYHRRYVFLSSM
jgi:hypothetical protein